MAWFNIFILLIVGIFVGIKLFAKPQKRTEAEFERNAAEGASFNALQGILDTAEAKAKEVQMQ